MPLGEQGPSLSLAGDDIILEIITLIGTPVDSWRTAINIGIAVVAMVAVGLLLAAVWYNRFDPVLSDLVVKNFATIIGLPFAFIASFVVVALFRQSEGQVDFEGFGFKFSGAAGQIVLWVLCFLVISGCIKLLWRNS